MLAYKYNSEVLEDGVIKLPKLHLAKGTKVKVLIIVPMEHETEDFSDLLHAAESSIDFWDNEIDDEVWNNNDKTEDIIVNHATQKFRPRSLPHSS